MSISAFKREAVKLALTVLAVVPIASLLFSHASAESISDFAKWVITAVTTIPISHFVSNYLDSKFPEE